MRNPPAAEATAARYICVRLPCLSHNHSDGRHQREVGVTGTAKEEKQWGEHSVTFGYGMLSSKNILNTENMFAMITLYVEPSAVW